VQSAGLWTFLQEIVTRSCRLNFAARPAQPGAAASATGGATAGSHVAEDQGQPGSPLKRAGEDDFLQGFSSAAD